MTASRRQSPGGGHGKRAKRELIGAGVTVRHRDREVIVADKPAGLISARLPGGVDQGTLVAVLAALLRGAGERDELHQVHRLDRDTSGLILFARAKPAHDKLIAALRHGEVERVYLALAAGDVGAKLGERAKLDAPVAAFNPGRQGRRDPVDAVTHIRVLACTRYAGKPVSFLECRLETGRTHQIRVHLADAGFPIVGDRLYRGSGPGIDAARMCLHATRLSFPHPSMRKRLTVESPWPLDLRKMYPTEHTSKKESK